MPLSPGGFRVAVVDILLSNVLDLRGFCFFLIIYCGVSCFRMYLFDYFRHLDRVQKFALKRVEVV